MDDLSPCVHGHLIASGTSDRPQGARGGFSNAHNRNNTDAHAGDPALNTAQVHKVASYCLSKLQEQNIVMELSPKYIRRPVYLSKEEAEPISSGRPVLELLCNGMVRGKSSL